MVVERGEKRLHVVGDRCRPVGRILRDLAIRLSPLNVVTGDADLGARHLGERVTLGDPLPDHDKHPRHDSPHRRVVIQPAAGVVVEAAGNGEVLPQRATLDGNDLDFTAGSRRGRKFHDRGGGVGRR